MKENYYNLLVESNEKFAKFIMIDFDKVSISISIPELERLLNNEHKDKDTIIKLLRSNDSYNINLAIELLKL